MTVLVTGGSGFAGGHLAAACARGGERVVAVSRSGAVADDVPGSVHGVAADLLDPDAARLVVAEARPRVVYHLAAQAHVGRSWEDPAGTLRENLQLTLNVLEAVRREAADAVVVAVASGEVYGPPARLPVTEDAELRPQNPYAVSKASGDLLARFYGDGHGLRVVRPRAFNHSGPGQAPVYAIASFARQLAAGLEAGDEPIRIVTGNPDTRRDYTDVRDVVRAYRLVAERGASGEAYNVCSGRTASARELVQALAALAGARVEHVVDSRLVRGHEVREVRGSFAKLRQATGWTPQMELEDTLRDSVEWWRRTIRSGVAA